MKSTSQLMSFLGRVMDIAMYATAATGAAKTTEGFINTEPSVRIHYLDSGVQAESPDLVLVPGWRFPAAIYIIKENRTYDQVLGDMKEGDGEAGLVYFPRPPSLTITR